MRFPTILTTTLLAFPVAAQDGTTPADTLHGAYDEAALDDGPSEATFEYQYGAVRLAGGVATLDLPDTFKFLGGEQARRLVVEVWENPPSIADKLEGVILYADAGAFDGRSAFIVYYDPIGYVSDEDADGIDYDAMLKNMLKEDSVENVQRVAEGYDALELVGWASPPFYDKQAKVLHWAKEMRLEDGDDNVLNYNIRVLGRHGVIIINGISGMSRLDMMDREVPVMIGLTSFNDGYRYDQFNAATDRVADRGVGGLIDGRVKERFMSALKLFVKVAAIALVCMVAIVALIIFLVRRGRKAPMS